MSDTSGSAILAGNPAATPAADIPSGQPVAVTDVTPGAAPAANGTWYDKIEDADLKGYVQNKGWSDPVELANGYRNLEKLLGGEKVPLPKGADDAEGWNRVYDSLGRPKDASGYKLSAPEGSDPAFVNEAAGKFHELGLSGRQAEQLAEWWASKQATAMDAFVQQGVQRAEQEVQGLRQEWGQAWDENVELGRRAAREFGLDQGKLAAVEQALGTGEMLKFMSRVGRGLVEHTFEGGKSTNSFGMTPEAARQRVGALRGDPEFSSKYLSGNVDAKAEMERLMCLAYPE
jgi:hypothetical protein